VSIDSYITDPINGRQVKVTTDRAIAVGPSNPSLSFNATLEVDDTPVNIVPAKGGHIFCVTGFVLTGNKNISATVDAVVNIYSATSATSATAVTTLLTIPVGRSAQSVITPVLVEAEEGLFINGKTTDDDVLVTLLGFYLDVNA